MGKQRSRSWVVRKPHKRHARADGRTKITVSGKPTRTDQLNRNLGGITSEEESPSQLSGGLCPPPRCHKRSNLCPTTSFPHTSCNFYRDKTAANVSAVNDWSRLLINRHRRNSSSTCVRVAFTAHSPWGHFLCFCFQMFTAAKIQPLEFQTQCTKKSMTMQLAIGWANLKTAATFGWCHFLICFTIFIVSYIDFYNLFMRVNLFFPSQLYKKW